MTGSESPSTTTSQRTDVAGWFLIGAIGVAALFLAFVHAPQRIKLPLLSPLVLGVLAGWGLGAWARARQVAAPRLILVASALLIVAGELGMAFETHRLGAPAIRTEMNRRKLEQAPLADQIEQAMIDEADDEAKRDQLRNESESARRRRREEFDRQQRLLTFAGYLESRIPTQWGRWPLPWPELFWGAEIVLSSVLGAWIARRCVQSPVSGEHQPSESTPASPLIQ